MITHVALSGFRSLQNFEIELHRGLNVLIGPNGSGKSNIIAFFTFLSLVMKHSLPEAVSRLGGAGSFFQKGAKESFTDQVTATVWGSIRVPDMSHPGQHQRQSRSVDYRYRFAVKASSDFSTLSLIEESLSFVGRNADDPISGERISESSDDWDFVMKKAIDGKGHSSSELVKWDQKHSQMFFGHMDRNNATLAEQRRQMVIEQVQGMSSNEHTILLPASIIFEPAALIRLDLTGGEILNITPSAVKRTEDSASPPGVRGDGAGVAATLYRLQHPGAERGQFGPWMFTEPQSTFDTSVPDKARAFNAVERYLRTVNPSIEQLIVANDPFDNRIKISVRIKTEQGSIDLPFTSMSDGTAKWLALVTAIVTAGSIFAIEEPENFIHPLMQREIVNIMRESTEHRETPALVVMTTHSETLLNVVRPDEVIVIDMINGFTRAIRPRDMKALEHHIRDTGFGLGHFYITGALADA